jgi:uncharacterized membrane protein YkvA (DUF1232 family)
MSGLVLGIAAAAGIVVLLYLSFVAALMVAGRRSHARALARFIPDCVVLFQRLVRDPRVPRSNRWLLAALVVYLIIPLDLVPDVIPVAGQLDDAIIVAFVLRRLLRSTDESLVASHWSGPPASLSVLLRLAGKAHRPKTAETRETAHATERS